ncbi:hypothetical protein F5Y10DRAFT_256213 [Nemania abortiva]|nr:hypothetical protein F5Y10DRAFT_256213 [Nemania abortiva]
MPIPLPDKLRFSYSLSRKYPSNYNWITPLAFLGAIAAITFVTIINVATIGFDSVAISTTNPNKTMTDGNPFGHTGLLSLLARGLKTTCTSTTLPLSSQFYSTNYAIQYTLTNVWRGGKDGTPKQNLGSLVYLNQSIDCDVTQVIIRVLGKYTQSPAVTAITRVGLQLETSATCSADIETSKSDTEGPTYFNLVGSWNLLDQPPHFLLTNKTDKASLWWGQSLLNVYYLITAHAYWEGASNFMWGMNGTYNAYIGLTRASKATQGSAEEVMSNEFFYVQCYTEANYCGNNSIPILSQGKAIDGNADPYANIWSSVDILGKAMWFTVMTDLGKNDTAIPNMLAYPDLLANLTANLTNEAIYWKNLSDSGIEKGTTIGTDHFIGNESFDPSTAAQAALGAQPSYLSTNYVCQVPRRKSGGIRALLILMSDILLLASIWKIFKLIADYIAKPDESDAAYCAGCLRSPVQVSSESVSKTATTTARSYFALGENR